MAILHTTMTFSAEMICIYSVSRPLVYDGGLSILTCYNICIHISVIYVFRCLLTHCCFFFVFFLFVFLEQIYSVVYVKCRVTCTVNLVDCSVQSSCCYMFVRLFVVVADVLIGQGAFGKVMKAYATDINGVEGRTTVAVKMVRGVYESAAAD